MDLLNDHVIKTVGSAGIKGELKVFTTHAIDDKNTLDKISNAVHSKLTFDGYDGEITTFLQPYYEPQGIK